MPFIFICYGGKQAKDVANQLNNFLKTETNMRSMVISPESRDVPVNDHETFLHTERKLMECNVAVFVCHEESKCSDPLKKELKFMCEQKMKDKTIIFSANDYCIPPDFRKTFWRPLHFAPEKPEESFRRLTNEIYRSCLEINEKKQLPQATSENKEIPLS
jgi:hypothetical protein